MKIFLIVVGVLLVAALVTYLALSGAFATKIADLRTRLIASQTADAPDQSLIPALVRDFATRNGGEIGGASAVEMKQNAEMRLQKDQPFFAIAATQVSGARVPGFVWDATGTMMGVIPLHVVDTYVAGAGWLEARIAETITVANATGPGIDIGEAMRFLAELPWNPDAMLNATGLTWRQIDEHTVEVSLTTSSGVASVSLLFDAAGDVVGTEADRPFAIEGVDVLTRWVGRFTDYVQVGAYRFPRHGEIAWMLPAGEFVYWRGEILSVVPMEVTGSK